VASIRGKSGELQNNPDARASTSDLLNLNISEQDLGMGGFFFFLNRVEAGGCQGLKVQRERK
jgi:hypothetical protein